MDEDKDMEGPDLTGKSGANKPDPKNPTNAPDESDEDKKQRKDAMARVAEQKDAVKKAIKRGAPAAKIAEAKELGTASDTLAKTATKSFLEMEADDDDDDDDDALIEEAQFADDDDDDDDDFLEIGMDEDKDME